MVLTNYQKGRAKEQYVKGKLVKAGWEVVRSASSKGIWDLCAVHRETQRIKFIQCKPKSMSKPAKKRLEEEHDWLNNEFIASFEVI